MRGLSFGFHDIIDPGRPDSSGFPGPAAGGYKLDIDDFFRHLESIARARTDKPSNALIVPSATAGPIPLFLTFDDGGASALQTADLLERLGWLGHFFVTVDFIGTKSFLTAAGVRELRERGHVVGSHSCSHPSRMSRLSPAVMNEEWGRSVSSLSDILGERVQIASVPGGYFSPDVARSAADCGVRVLFTSEPSTRIRTIKRCVVLGRFTIRRGDSPKVTGDLACGKVLPRIRQGIEWELKRLAKTIGGEHYLLIRRFLLAQRNRA